MEIQISGELQEIIRYSREEALRTGCYGISPDHFFLGILRHNDNNAMKVLKGLGMDTVQMKAFIDERVTTRESIPYEDIERISFTRAAQNVLQMTVLEASRKHFSQAYSQHCMLALCRVSGSYGAAFLRNHGVDYGKLLIYMEKEGLMGSRPQGSSSSPSSSQQANSDDGDDIGVEFNSPERGEGDSPDLRELEAYTFDLTAAAAEGKLDPVVGRENEINRVIEILGRRKKNNPMLIGEPGVGKSAIVEGIAQRISKGEISPVFAKKRILTLDIASVVAGTKYRGDFEQRLKNILAAAKADPNLILFIDEFHTIIGAGGASGSLDAANMLKPALARGEIQCIGATTMDEFSKIVEKDGALDRRFQKVVVESTDIPQSIAILKKLQPNYEKYHSLSYGEGAIEACVTLSDRYITDRTLPDKAIDAMDEAASMVKLRSASGKREPVVTPDDVAEVVSKITGIPVNKVAESEGNRILRMKDRLRGRIIGQDEAIDKVCAAIRRNRAGLKDPGRPIGSFLFFGPTGVGKTQLAKCLAEYLFDSEENIVRLDMSEYMEKFSVSRLIGAPPGYVGYEEGGQLSERVRRKPYCVVLLDEIEKAHPDIFNILLQILDDGRLTDSEGRTVNFKNTIVIMTSNIGSREIEQFGNGIGFSTSVTDVGKTHQSILEKAVKKAFPPEFINRVDEKVFFSALGKDEIEKIIDIELLSLRKRAEEAGYKINVTPKAKRFVAEAGYDPAYGARPLKRAIMKYIEDPVSEFIITDRVLSSKKDKGATQALKTLRLTVSKEGDGLSVEAVPQKVLEE